MDKTNSVGIDAMAFHGPECFVEMADLALARGVDPAKYVKGLGQRQMAVASPCEDTVTMAASAGAKALAQFNIDPADIGTLIVGTETGVDHSKPAAVYVHELLGLANNCRTFETKHACYGAMAGLTSAMDWINAGRARGKKALIIASDIARYGLGTPGEPTQGAGAVAMVIAKAPRLLALDSEVFGDYTRQVMDFWRPLYSKHAFADGHYSIECYLDALAACWDDAHGKTGIAANHRLPALDACFYHVPFTRMAAKAHTRHWEAELGRKLGADDAEHHMKIADSYQVQVAPWLGLNSVVGNIYTGSLFLAVMDYLRQLSPDGEQARTISLFSYGSGCGAALCFADVVAGAADWAGALDPQPELDQRRRMDIGQYEHLVRAGEEADANGTDVANPKRWGLTGDILFTGTVDHQRCYQRTHSG